MTQEQEHSVGSFCAEKIRQLDEHLKDAPARIADVATTKQQILNLDANYKGVMDDIKDIKLTNEAIKTQVAGLETKIATNQAETKDAIKNVANEVKLWVVSGIIIGLLGLAGTICASLASFGNMNMHLGENVRQIDVDTKRIDILEEIQRNIPREQNTEIYNTNKKD